MKIVQRASRQPVVRIYFPCQLMPADANEERMQDLMEWGGVMKNSQAYFVVGGKGTNRMLYLVTEISTEKLTTAKLKEDINVLCEAATETSHVWSAKLNTPLAKSETRR